MHDEGDKNTTTAGSECSFTGQYCSVQGTGHDEGQAAVDLHFVKHALQHRNTQQSQYTLCRRLYYVMYQTADPIMLTGRN